MVGDLRRVHVMKLLKTRDRHYHNSRAFDAGTAAADQGMRRDALRQLVKLDALDMLADVRLLPALSLFRRASPPSPYPPPAGHRARCALIITQSTPAYAARIEYAAKGERGSTCPKPTSSPAPPRFIGSHIAERLLRDGQRVRVIDNLLTGKQAHLDFLASLGGDLSITIGQRHRARDPWVLSFIMPTTSCIKRRCPPSRAASPTRSRPIAIASPARSIC